ncbi:MAG: hypothetical protein ACAI44_29355 [Candidatus Sericytochromatia bacterium]
MTRYFRTLTRTRWEGVQPFDRLEGKRIYLSPAFERLSARQKKHVLSLLLLDYGDYKPLLQLLPSRQRHEIALSGGAMVPYEVYSSDGRLVSLPYNGCNRLTMLTEYERARIGFLGVASLNHGRVQRYPMSRWQQERIKKLFWQSVGYQRAGEYWIAWVPESGHFEIDVPSLNHGQVLRPFWQSAPSYYRYVVVDRGRRLYSQVRGQRSAP